MSWRRILGVFYRYFYVSKKGLHQLTDLFYWPVVDILIWGLTSFWIQTQSHADQLVPILLTGLIFWQVVWRGSIEVSTSLLQEFWHRNLVNLFSTPLKISEWIVGMLLLGLCKLLIAIAFGSTIVYLLFSVNVFAIGFSFLPLTFSLLVFGWALSFLSASLIIRWGHKVEVIAWMIAYLFEPFSAVFYPVAVLPLWAQKIAWCLPATYAFEGMREILKTGAFPTLYFWQSMALNLFYLIGAFAIFKWMFRKTLDKGLARLE